MYGLYGPLDGYDGLLVDILDIKLDNLSISGIVHHIYQCHLFVVLWAMGSIVIIMIIFPCY